MLTELKESMAERNIARLWNGKVASFLAENSHSAKFGARNLRRLIQKQIEDKVASLIIERAEQKLDAVSLAVENGQIAAEAL